MSVPKFSAAACKIQCSKCYIESLPSSMSTVQLPLDCAFALQKWDA